MICTKITEKKHPNTFVTAHCRILKFNGVQFSLV